MATVLSPGVFASETFLIKLQNSVRLRNDFFVILRLQTGGSKTCFNPERKNLRSVDSKVTLEALCFDSKVKIIMVTIEHLERLECFQVY